MMSLNVQFLAVWKQRKDIQSSSRIINHPSERWYRKGHMKTLKLSINAAV